LKLLQNVLGRWGLEHAKFEEIMRVSVKDKVHKGIAKIADPIKYNDFGVYVPLMWGD